MARKQKKKCFTSINNKTKEGNLISVALFPIESQLKEIKKSPIS